MIKELDLVVLTHDIEEFGLKSGDLGTVVHCYESERGFEVEFVTAERKTIAVVTLTPEDLRPFENAEIVHSRELTSI